MRVSGDRIKQARQICGLSEEELAERIHCTERQLVRYETDLDEPPDEMVERIAIATSFPPKFFRQPPGPEFPMGSLLLHSFHTPRSDYKLEQPKKDLLILQVDRNTSPNVLTLLVHPVDYQRIAGLIKEGLVLKGSPQTVDGEIVDIERQS